MPDLTDATPTSFTKSPDAKKADKANGRPVDDKPTPDATAGVPVTAEPAHQTPMLKPVTNAPAFAGPDNPDVPSAAEQAADTLDPEPLKGIEVQGPAPVLGAPIGVNPIVPQATEVVVGVVTKPAPEPVEIDPAMSEQHAVIPMRAPENGGTDLFETDADGITHVPAKMVETMRAHGFEVAVDDGHHVENDPDSPTEEDMRYTAPPHTSDVTLASGTFPVVDGTVDVPDDLGTGDVSGLRANGFTPQAVTPAEKVAELVDQHSKAELLDKAGDLDVKPSDPKPVIAEAIVNAGLVPLIAGSTAPTGPDPVTDAKVVTPMAVAPEPQAPAAEAQA